MSFSSLVCSRYSVSSRVLTWPSTGSMSISLNTSCKGVFVRKVNRGDRYKVYVNIFPGPIWMGESLEYKTLILLRLRNQRWKGRLGNSADYECSRLSTPIAAKDVWRNVPPSNVISAVIIIHSKYFSASDGLRSLNSSMQRQSGMHIINVIFVDYIEGVQRAAAIFCKSDYHYTFSVSIMLDSFGLETLETRRKLSRLCKMYKIIHGLVDLNIHNYLQFSKETITWNSHVYKFQTPFGSIVLTN